MLAGGGGGTGAGGGAETARLRESLNQESARRQAAEEMLGTMQGHLAQATSDGVLTTEALAGARARSEALGAEKVSISTRILG